MTSVIAKSSHLLCIQIIFLLLGTINTQSLTLGKLDRLHRFVMESKLKGEEYKRQTGDNFGGEKVKREPEIVDDKRYDVIKFVQNEAGEWVPTLVLKKYLPDEDEEDHLEKEISDLKSTLTKSMKQGLKSEVKISMGSTLRERLSHVMDELESDIKNEFGFTRSISTVASNRNILRTQFLENPGVVVSRSTSFTPDKRETEPLELNLLDPNKKVQVFKNSRLKSNPSPAKTGTRRIDLSEEDELPTSQEVAETPPVPDASSTSRQTPGHVRNVQFGMKINRQKSRGGNDYVPEDQTELKAPQELAEPHAGDRTRHHHVLQPVLQVEQEVHQPIKKTQQQQHPSQGAKASGEASTSRPVKIRENVKSADRPPRISPRRTGSSGSLKNKNLSPEEWLKRFYGEESTENNVVDLRITTSSPGDDTSFTKKLSLQRRSGRPVSSKSGGGGQHSINRRQKVGSSTGNNRVNIEDAEDNSQEDGMGNDIGVQVGETLSDIVGVSAKRLKQLGNSVQGQLQQLSSGVQKQLEQLGGNLNLNLFDNSQFNSLDLENSGVPFDGAGPNYLHSQQFSNDAFAVDPVPPQSDFNTLKAFQVKMNDNLLSYYKQPDHPKLTAPAPKPASKPVIKPTVDKPKATRPKSQAPFRPQNNEIPVSVFDLEPYKDSSTGSVFSDLPRSSFFEGFTYNAEPVASFKHKEIEIGSPGVSGEFQSFFDDDFHFEIPRFSNVPNRRQDSLKEYVRQVPNQLQPRGLKGQKLSQNEAALRGNVVEAREHNYDDAELYRHSPYQRQTSLRDPAKRPAVGQRAGGSDPLGLFATSWSQFTV